MMLLNNDATVDPGVIEGFERAARARPRAGILAGKLYFADRPQTIWFAGQRVSELLGYSGRPRGYGRADGPRYGDVRVTGRAAGALMAISREAVQAAGLLDEELFAYVEDVDWALRVRAADLEVVFAPDARAWHRVSASSGGEARSTATLYYGIRNTVTVLERHRPLGPTADRPATRLDPRHLRAARADPAPTAARRCAPCAPATRTRARAGWARARRSRQRPAVALERRLRRRRPAEAGGPGRAPARAGVAARVALAEQAPDRRGDVRGRVRVEVDRRRPGRLVQDRQVRAGDRHAAGHRFEHRQPEPLVERRQRDARRRARRGRRARPASTDPRPRTSCATPAACACARSAARIGSAPAEHEHRARRAGRAAPARPPARAGSCAAGCSPGRARPRARPGRGGGAARRGRAARRRRSSPRRAGITSIRSRATPSPATISSAAACDPVITRCAPRAARRIIPAVPARASGESSSGSARYWRSWIVTTRRNGPHGGAKFAGACTSSTRARRAAAGTSASSPSAQSGRLRAETGSVTWRTRSPRAAASSGPASRPTNATNVSVGSCASIAGTSSRT